MEGKKVKTHSHLYMDVKGHEFKRDMKRIIKAIYDGKVIDNPCKVHFQFFYKGNLGRDFDSGLKITTDSLQKTLIKDDNLIKIGLIEMFEPSKQNEVRIFITELNSEELSRIEKMKDN